MNITKFFNIEEPYHLSEKNVNIRKIGAPTVAVDILIPVYKGYEQTKRCINSVLNTSLANEKTRVIVINDCSPDSRINRYLENLAKDKIILLFNNDVNRGFIATVNYGMSLSKKNDVVLLNSDTEVCGDWLNKMIWHAYSKKKVGTVTPFSNNATICSYPDLNGFDQFPNKTNLQDFDSAFFLANKHKNLNIPTAVGFCMYIRRKCLDDIGLFDEIKFGKGYGEENEFCLRATESGWVHLLAGDTFVYHEGAVSFSKESEGRKKKALKTLTTLYPEYHSLIIEHIKKNEVYPLILSVIFERIKRDKRPKVLHILHDLGGGTEKYVKELADKTSNDGLHFVMMPLINDSGHKKYHIFSANEFEKINVSIDMNKSSVLTNFLSSLDISFVHIHHVMNYPFQKLKNIINKINVPHYITIHDYMFICPRITLIHAKTNLYCNEPNTKECNSCIKIDRPFGANNITSWREGYENIIHGAEKVICPSVDVANRIKKYYPKSKISIAYHEDLINAPKNIIINSISKNKSARIAMIGTLAPHKGGKLISNMMRIIDKNKKNYELKLIGFVQNHPSTKSLINNKHFSSTGKYDDSKLQQEIRKYNPHLVLFASQCPETYCYTLSAALRGGFPILAPSIGAFLERLNLRPWTWIYKDTIKAEELLKLIHEIIAQHIAKKNPPKINKLLTTQANIIKNFYKNDYFKY